MALPDLVLATVPLIQWSLICTLLFTAGIAWSFNVFLLPIIKLNPTTTAIPQLLHITTIGARTLDPANIIVALVLVLVSVLQAVYSDFSITTSWRVTALAAFILFQVAWWERLTVFPLERQAKATQERLEGAKGAESREGTWMKERDRAQFSKLLSRWGLMHMGRGTPPLIAVGMLIVWRG
ncbi:hypothetical protein DOTSEDRAFT_54011 [Dothistroma septosporum NZE10]|uniref:DUF1772-domain-containing protein n=1 Tax=Dothistroma septosporum (strain NZE10 / CBS 128990) TaxID=675120 RepID=M2WM29_DOTSN|nr:hypothetical protein DOTSEDRAFT_54011 [Dothistroma septosporum NZE10]